MKEERNAEKRIKEGINKRMRKRRRKEGSN